MNKLVLLLWSIFFLSCGCIKNTLKNNTVTEIQKTPQKENVSQTNEIRKTDVIRIDNEIPKSTSPEKAVTKNASALTIKKNKIETENPIIKASTKITPTVKNKSPNVSKEITAIWNELLIKHVNDNGDVNYNGFLKDKNKLQIYLNEMAVNSPKTGWSKKEKMVYYINIYNAGTVKLILDNYPTKSIKDIHKPWAKEIIKIGEHTFSLGNIEHKILRKMNDPRIHFAINCASYSCPKLINKAFTVSNLEKMLEAATRGFINDPTRNKIMADKLQLSHIFKWYKKDFTVKGSLIDYINAYIKINSKEKAAISFLKYDWSLNEAK